MIKATVVLMAAWLIVPRLRRRSAAERHLLWGTALGAAAVLPVIAALIPAWQPQWAGAVANALPHAFDDLALWTGARNDVVVRASGLETGNWTWDIAIDVWLAGALTVFARLGLQWTKLRRTVSASGPIADLRLLRVANDVARAVGLRRPPVLLQSPALTIPITWGARRPRVLLPADSCTWTDERTASVLLHEMAHARRRDWLFHLLAEAVCGAYWFHPLFWLARNRMRHESERAADDVVLNAGIDGRDYAATLLAIVRGARVLPPVPSVAMARASDLGARITSLLAASSNRREASRRMACSATTAAALVVLPLGAIAAPDIVGYVQVRTAALPKALLAAVSPASTASASAVRSIRLAARSPEVITDTPPEVLEYTTPPLYSDEGRMRGIEGVIVARARVDADGRVVVAQVSKGLGYGLDQNALVALRQWRFRPGMREGLPAAMDVEVEIEYSLRQEALNELIANDMATQVGPGVTPPRAVLTVQPPRLDRASGRVMLDVVLLEDGSPKIVRVLRSATPELDEMAVRTFEQWRFSPAMKDGRAVKVRMNAEVRFDG